MNLSSLQLFTPSTMAALAVAAFAATANAVPKKLGAAAWEFDNVSGAKSHERRVVADRFVNPPKENYPQTWFHMIGGNVSKEGLMADLEAISGAGISGIQQHLVPNRR